MTGLNVPGGNGFSMVDGLLAWKNSSEERPVCVKDIKDEITFDNCCNSAIIWWTENLIELEKTKNYLCIFPNELEGAMDSLRLWRALKTVGCKSSFM